MTLAISDLFHVPHGEASRRAGCGEIRTSGSMSGDGKRGVAAWPKLPRPSSTLPKVWVRSCLADDCYQVSTGRSSPLASRPYRRDRLNRPMSLADHELSIAPLHLLVPEDLPEEWDAFLPLPAS